MRAHVLGLTCCCARSCAHRPLLLGRFEGILASDTMPLLEGLVQEYGPPATAPPKAAPPKAAPPKAATPKAGAKRAAAAGASSVAGKAATAAASAVKAGPTGAYHVAMQVLQRAGSLPCSGLQSGSLNGGSPQNGSLQIRSPHNGSLLIGSPQGACSLQHSGRPSGRLLPRPDSQGESEECDEHFDPVALARDAAQRVQLQAGEGDSAEASRSGSPRCRAIAAAARNDVGASRMSRAAELCAAAGEMMRRASAPGGTPPAAAVELEWRQGMRDTVRGLSDVVCDMLGSPPVPPPPPLEDPTCSGGGASAEQPSSSCREQKQQQAEGLWWQGVPPAWRRKAASRGEQDYLFTPDWTDLQPGAPEQAAAVALFQQRWAAGEPVIVRNCQVRAGRDGVRGSPPHIYVCVYMD